MKMEPRSNVSMDVQTCVYGYMRFSPLKFVNITLFPLEVFALSVVAGTMRFYMTFFIFEYDEDTFGLVKQFGLDNFGSRENVFITIFSLALKKSESMVTKILVDVVHGQPWLQPRGGEFNLVGALNGSIDKLAKKGEIGFATSAYLRLFP